MNNDEKIKAVLNEQNEINKLIDSIECISVVRREFYKTILNQETERNETKKVNI